MSLARPHVHHIVWPRHHHLPNLRVCASFPITDNDNQSLHTLAGPILSGTDLSWPWPWSTQTALAWNGLSSLVVLAAHVNSNFLLKLNILACLECECGHLGTASLRLRDPSVLHLIDSSTQGITLLSYSLFLLAARGHHTHCSTKYMSISGCKFNETLTWP